MTWGRDGFDVVDTTPSSVGARPRTPVAASSTGTTEMRTIQHLNAAEGRGVAPPARFCPRSDPPKGALVGLHSAARSRPGARSRFNHIDRNLSALRGRARSEFADLLGPRLCTAAAVRGEYEVLPTLVEPTSSATADTGSTPVASTLRRGQCGTPSRTKRLPHARERGRPVTATGTLEIAGYGTRTKYEWNGNVADREAARAAFDEAWAYGMTLASVVDSPGHETQVRSFDEIEKIEKERGVVTAHQSAPLVGG